MESLTGAPDWLLYCRPGFEQDCAQETQAEILEATPDSGFVRVRGKPKLTLNQLAFSRQLIRLFGELTDLPERDRLTPILNLLAQQPSPFGALLLETPDTNDGKTLSGFTRRFQPILEEALRTASRCQLQPDPAALRLHLFFPDGQRVLFGSSDPANSSPAHMGIQRLKMSPDAPSRSYLKLAEAFEIMLSREEQARWLKPGMTAVDLGAAPGGWTWQLVQRGMKVIAVDNGAMKGAAAHHSAIRHLHQDGFRFRPTRPVDWLVCDMVEQPQRVAALMSEWIMDGHAKRAIFNLKLPMKKRQAALSEALKQISGLFASRGLTPRLRVKQLYHDREEVTVFLSRPVQ